MPGSFHITNVNVVNEGRIFKGEVIISEGVISRILHEHEHFRPYDSEDEFIRIDAEGKYLLPGVIDDQVHFREPGLTHKGDIHSESRAAVAGGVTSFMDMPNVLPQTLTQKLLEERYKIAAKKSMANYSFYMGTSNDNAEEVIRTDPRSVCGIKIFMGASTGNMLVDDPVTLSTIFQKAKTLIAVHCEDEPTITNNLAAFKEKYGEDIPIDAHPLIRSHESCYRSSSFAVQLAQQFNTRLHVLHLSTADEMALFDPEIPLEEKRITAEVCVHHLWFSDEDYTRLGTNIKWNPAIKTLSDREALWQALLENRIDVVATDHAPHTKEEKNNKYLKAPSGGPLVQHSLTAMLEAYRNGRISLERVVEKMCHAPAICFSIDKRGFIRENYWADLVLVDLDSPWTVEPSNLLYKCGWSPFEGTEFHARVTHTFINGALVYEAYPNVLKDSFNEQFRGMRLSFNR